MPLNLHELVLQGDTGLAAIKALAETQPDEFKLQVRAVDDIGRTPLFLAAINTASTSSEATVEFLLPYSDVKQQNISGVDALMAAIVHSEGSSTERTVELLLPHSDTKQCSVSGNTALTFAITSGSSLSVLELLVPHSDITHTTNRGFTALALAVAYAGRSSSVAAVKLLMQYDDPRRLLAGRINLLMIRLCQSKRTACDEELVRLLLPYTDLAHSDLLGNTALSLALAKRELTDPIISLLLEHAPESEVLKAFEQHPQLATQLFLQQRQRLSERETFKAALREGLSLPTANVLKFL